MIKLMPPWKSPFEKYSRNLSSKISLPISHPAPILHKKKIISVRSLLLSGSVHFLMTWGLGLGSNRRCYYQRFLSSTLVSKSSKTFLEKPSVDSANTLSKHMCTSCTAHPPEASFCEPQNFSLPQLLQCWNASTFVLVTVWVFVFAPSSHWNLFTPFATDWECSATPMLIQVIPLLILNLQLILIKITNVKLTITRSFFSDSEKTNCMWLPLRNTAEMLHRFFQVADSALPPSARKLHLFSQFPTLVLFM